MRTTLPEDFKTSGSYFQTKTRKEKYVIIDGITNNSQHSDENWTGKAATLVLTKSGVRYTKAVTFYS